jgi:hypothetical protein
MLAHESKVPLPHLRTYNLLDQASSVTSPVIAIEAGRGGAASHEEQVRVAGSSKGSLTLPAGARHDTLGRSVSPVRTAQSRVCRNKPATVQD